MHNYRRWRARAARARKRDQTAPRPSTSQPLLSPEPPFFFSLYSFPPRPLSRLGSGPSRSLLQPTTRPIPQSKHIPFSHTPSASASALAAAAAASTLLSPLPPPRQVKPHAPWPLVRSGVAPARLPTRLDGGGGAGRGVRVRVAGRLIFLIVRGGADRTMSWFLSRPGR